ncbi:ribosome-associated translation inhibitor RaiA [Aequorivita sp. H23M31]|uniref:Ribosome-associated translation inhibitor RaiA n=1 Tax=Aequorivita ciconiae TaxID=2494375 RepID=A0A410G117_9FLAO|nr:ribosome-associated translation inhibitor RaiA [Aequorivita sp. H23M31]QAA80939.1 ribosome-associated translation inhibitor RaiA [Aequorivita sp. H23M31]
MNIHFEYHDVAASSRLEEFISEKLNKLENKYDFIISADVYFKKENSSNPELGKVCSVRLGTPGPTVFAEISSGTFEASIAKVITELRSQLQKRKEKMKLH